MSTKKVDRPKYIVKVTRDWRYGKRARFWDIQKWYQAGKNPEDGYWGNACGGGIAYTERGMWRAINRKLKKMSYGYHESYFSLNKQSIKEPK
jgi:hypothetical protein